MIIPLRFPTILLLALLAALVAPVGQTQTQVALDELVKHMTYDGLGRLVRVQSPYPDPSAGAANGELRTERFHYDGIRRIQEVLTDPLLDTDGAADGGETAAMSALLEEPQLDGSAVTLGSESNQTDGPTPAPPPQYLEREYIWGPGDNGIDELLVQFDRQRDAWWVVQDAGLDAIAVCDLGGSGGAVRVVWQGTYDAYGAVLSAESLYAHAHVRIGHKGLFFDRLDGGVVEQYTLAETPRLAAGPTSSATTATATPDRPWGGSSRATPTRPGFQFSTIRGRSTVGRRWWTLPGSTCGSTSAMG